MAQERQNVYYGFMINKSINEWEECNLREFCFSEKVNIYRMLKTMKRMGISKETVVHGLRLLTISEKQKLNYSVGINGYFADGCVHNVKLTCGKGVLVVIKCCSPVILVRLILTMRVICTD